MSAVNAILERMYSSGCVPGSTGREFPIWPTSIGAHKGRALYQWLRATRPQTTLEIGLALGASALFICQALEDNGSGHHYAIDPWERTVWDAAGLQAVAEAHLTHRLTFCDTPAHLQLPALLREKLPVEFAFVDGQHLFDYVFLDCFYVDLLLPVGGVMAVDDAWMPSVRKTVRFLVRNRGYRVVAATHRFIRGALAPPGWCRLLEWALAWDVMDMTHPLFRAQTLLFLRKTRDDDRAWDWHRTF